MSTWRENYRNATIFYVMYSETLNIVKVGITKNLVRRQQLLNSHRLGGADDFEVVSSVYLGERAGPFETLVLKHFSDKVKPIEYLAKSEVTTTKEALDIPVETVIRFCAEILKRLHHQGFIAFISCREFHRSDLWARRTSTQALRKIKEGYNPPVSMTPLSEVIWQRHGIIPAIAASVSAKCTPDDLKLTQIKLGIATHAVKKETVRTSEIAY